jgi:hypothetical protein
MLLLGAERQFEDSKLAGTLRLYSELELGARTTQLACLSTVQRCGFYALHTSCAVPLGTNNLQDPSVEESETHLKHSEPTLIIIIVDGI